ncbi:MAG: hypothetical protein N2252_06360, partial [Candidatus Kryptonium sp.]|nr:hypothetical protein [Candidatus Kryptonium sp.]
MRKVLLILGILILLVFLTSTSFSQARLKYKFTATTGTYTEITDGSTFSWFGTADSGYSSAVSIGFTFNYNGFNYDSFQVTTNGFLRLGTGLANSPQVNDLGGITRRILAPLWDDLAAPAFGNITYKLEGDPGSRVLTVQWKDMRWVKTATTSAINFQVKLYEGTNTIEFVYGPGTVGGLSTDRTASIGLNDETAISVADRATGTFLSINIGGTLAARVYHQTMSLEFDKISIFPPNGTIFRFEPVTTISPLSGTYTVGGTAPDFATLSDAAMALNIHGVNGPVTLLVRPGTYDDIFHLINVAGTSPTNTITVTKESGEVTISPRNGSYTTTAPLVLSGDAIIRLDGTQYVTIDGLKLTNNPDNTNDQLRFDVGVFLAHSA